MRRFGRYWRSARTERGRKRGEKIVFTSAPQGRTGKFSSRPKASIPSSRNDLHSGRFTEPSRAFPKRHTDLQDAEVDIWVNNAGMGGNGCFDNLETTTVLEMVRLNIEALSDLTSQVVKRMKQRRQGAILQVGSVAGLMPLPTMGLYAATKAFVLSLTDSLSAELAGTGISIHSLNPGPVRTRIS